MTPWNRTWGMMGRGAGWPRRRQSRKRSIALNRGGTEEAPLLEVDAEDPPAAPAVEAKFRLGL